MCYSVRQRGALEYLPRCVALGANPVAHSRSGNCECLKFQNLSSLSRRDSRHPQQNRTLLSSAHAQSGHCSHSRVSVAHDDRARS